MTEALYLGFARSLRSRGRAPRTVDGYLSDLSQLQKLTGKKLMWELTQQLTPTDLYKVLDDAPYAPATKSRMLASAKQWHRWGAARELWSLNGIMAIPSPSVTTTRKAPLTDEQVAWLLEHGTDPEERRLLLPGLFAATRIAESARLDKSHWLEDRLRFPAKGKGGAGKIREVPLASPLVDEMGPILSVSKTRRQLLYVYEKLRDSSPFVWTPQSLRRTFSQRLLDHGAPVPVVEELMGHVHRSTTLTHYGAIPWPQLVHWMKVFDGYGQMRLW